MNKLKKAYFNIKLNDQEIEKSWQDLKSKISYTPKVSYFRYSAIFLSLMILFLSGLVGLTQAAGPASPLYSVKILSDKITGRILNKPEIPVENRAQDLLDASEPEKIEAASKQYSKALDDAEKDVKKDENKKERLEKSLKEQEEEFKKEIRENPESEKKLEKILEKTKDTKEKISGRRKDKENGN